jgi:hypothetical protein
LDMRNTLAMLLLVIDEAWLDHSASIASHHHISSKEDDLEKFLISSELLLRGIYLTIEQGRIDDFIINEPAVP